MDQRGLYRITRRRHPESLYPAQSLSLLHKALNAEEGSDLTSAFK